MGMRTDVTTINLSMMTYQWFSHTHDLYPSLKFPAGHYGSEEGARADLEIVGQWDSDSPRPGRFSLQELLQANPTRPIFLSGKLNHPDKGLEEAFAYVPIGLTTLLAPLSGAPNGTDFHPLNNVAWSRVFSMMPELPTSSQYGKVTKTPLTFFHLKQIRFSFFVFLFSFLFSLLLS
jgi:hypothetical protein